MYDLFTISPFEIISSNPFSFFTNIPQISGSSGVICEIDMQAKRLVGIDK